MSGHGHIGQVPDCDEEGQAPGFWAVAKDNDHNAWADADGQGEADLLANGRKEPTNETTMENIMKYKLIL